MKIFFFLTLILSFESFANNKTICGATDDRTLSFDSKIGRAASMNREVGCTVTLIGKSCAISAGHCVGALEKISFNVPISQNTIPQASDLKDIYYRTKDFLRYKDSGSGNDWSVIRLLQNKETGLYPGEAQGFYGVHLGNTSNLKDSVRITGFGVDANDKEGNFAQQTHAGSITKLGNFFNKAKLGYSVDTMGGNSGSSVILESSNKIIGVHSHGYCTASGGQNEGTLIAKNKIFKQVVEQCLEWEKSL